MNDFTASNGMRIDASNPTGVVILDDDGDNTLRGYEALDRNDMQALREFFQAEADKRLGRWRYAKEPDYVVYLEDEYAVVVSESDPSRHPDRVHRRYLEDPVGSLGWGEFAARAYFDAHPEPKPWRDAAAGEVWLLTIDREADVPSVASSSEGGHVVFTAATGGAGGTEEIAPESNYITAGCRIFPEVS